MSPGRVYKMSVCLLFFYVQSFESEPCAVELEVTRAAVRSYTQQGDKLLEMTALTC